MNEFGSTYLDMDDDDDYIDQKIQIPEPETTQKITQSTDDTNAESHLTTSDSPVSAQEEKEQEEEDQNKNVGGSGAGFQEETHEIPVVPNQQGGSPSSSWLGSSVTGWLGLGKEDQPDSVVEGEIEDKREDTQSETLTSSVTGWLGFGENGKPDNGKENVKLKEETAESLTSTMTGWLSFGGGSKTEIEEEQEADEDKEPTEKFRSRRMSLDLEGSQLQEEEKKEMGTLGWLGNGLSSTLGFGLTSQESGQEKEEKMQANSWLNMEIEGILGFRKDKVGDNENKESESKEAEIITTLEQPTCNQHDRRMWITVNQRRKLLRQAIIQRRWKNCQKTKISRLQNHLMVRVLIATQIFQTAISMKRLNPQLITKIFLLKGSLKKNLRS